MESKIDIDGLKIPYGNYDVPFDVNPFIDKIPGYREQPNKKISWVESFLVENIDRIFAEIENGVITKEAWEKHGGIDGKRHHGYVMQRGKLKKKKIRVSLFINPNLADVKISKQLKADCIELHTGKYCRLLNMKKPTTSEYNKIVNSAFYAKKNNLEVHAGHGLTYSSTSRISKIKDISEFNIGHFIISESIFQGLPKVVKKFKKIINR